jgi:hypothetical protein
MLCVNTVAWRTDLDPDPTAARPQSAQEVLAATLAAYRAEHAACGPPSPDRDWARRLYHDSAALLAELTGDPLRRIPLSDLYAAINDTFWSSPAALALLHIQSDKTLEDMIFAISIYARELHSGRPGDTVDAIGALPPSLEIPIEAFTWLQKTPLHRALTAAYHAVADEPDEMPLLG